jgi:hypothetical protein
MDHTLVEQVSRADTSGGRLTPVPGSPFAEKSAGYAAGVDIICECSLAFVAGVDWAVPKPIEVNVFSLGRDGALKNLASIQHTDASRNLTVARLSNIREFTTRPASAIIKYADSNSGSLAAGRELGVDSILEGTIQRSGDQIRVRVLLLNVSDGRPLWTQSFDEGVAD